MAFPVQRELTERAEARRDHYCRSSVVLPFEGYNNPATFSSSESASDLRQIHLFRSVSI